MAPNEAVMFIQPESKKFTFAFRLNRKITETKTDHLAVYSIKWKVIK